MKKMRCTLLLSVFFTVVCVSTVSASSAWPVEEIIKKFKAFYPNVQIDSLTASPIDGLYEIISGSNIAYYHPEKDILIVGNMIQKGKNITNQRMMDVQAEKIKHLPLDKAIKIGSGKHQVVEFTDPDCPYCRKAFDYFNDRDDVTKYVFLLPLTNLHPQAEAKVRYVFDAEDPVKAYKEAMSGALDQKDFSGRTFSEKANSRLAEHKSIAAKSAVSSTPTFWINGQFVPGADIKKFNQLLGERAETTKEGQKAK